jgi:hypothetical protein
MPVEADPSQPPDPDLMLDVAREALADQLQAIDALDGKLGMVLGIGTALVGLVAAVVALRPHTLTVSGWLAVCFAAGVYLCLLARVVSAMRPQRWDWGPELDWLWGETTSGNDGRDLRWSLALRYKEDVTANAVMLGFKASALWWGLGLLVAEAVALSALALVLTFS